MKHNYSRVYFPYFANIILEQRNIDIEIIHTLFDIFFAKSGYTYELRRLLYETLGDVELLKVIVMKTIKQTLVKYNSIKDILYMEYYNCYRQIGSYTKYAHSLGLVDFNQINKNTEECIQFVMKKLII
jgi:hypothetical protein